MRILLLGYGKMGKVIERIALERGHSIVARIDADNQEELLELSQAQGTDRYPDAAIEFSQPNSAFNNLQFCLHNNIPVVCGTTGWLEQKPVIEQLARDKAGLFFYASNYSIGVNLFFRFNKLLATWMNAFPQYEVSITEIHHTEKKDAPSGTAITLADTLVAGLDRKTDWRGDENLNSVQAAINEVAIHSLREGKVPGTHAVKYTSAVDTIEIIHTAHSREGFALGAVVAAEWLAGQRLTGQSGAFGMEDMMAELKG
ncbi:MAG: 4-hydroxy-tetrahydrodipicolinate reductase [Bacteroidota bacterium]